VFSLGYLGKGGANLDKAGKAREELKQRIDNLRVTLDRLGENGEKETRDRVGGTIRKLQHELKERFDEEY
jgi:hypothetical protein